ncbi:MAG: hypothetical protein AAGF33_19605 [Pseudomonadota bacterium]
MEAATVDLDLGKDVFQVHGITANGTPQNGAELAPQKTNRSSGHLGRKAALVPEPTHAALSVIVNITQVRAH